MKRAKTSLPDNWNIQVIEYGEDSPMENHKGMEVAVDDESKSFFVYETHLVAYGLDSVEKACRHYISNRG